MEGDTNQTYLVNEPGIYWVLVEDSCGNTGSDTILVNPQPYFDFGESCIDSTQISFWDQYQMTIPCSYLFRDCVYLDSHFFDIYSKDQKIHLFNERYALDDIDTIEFLSTIVNYEDSIEIKNNQGEFVGVLFFNQNGSDFRNIEGMFYYRVDDVFIELVRTSISNDMIDEVKRIFSTIITGTIKSN